MRRNGNSKYLYGSEILRELVNEEVALDSLYSAGHWITYNGKPMFIGGAQRKDRPKKARKEVGKWKVRKKADGSTVTDKSGNPVKEFWVPKKWVEQNQRYKFAITAALANNSERIEQNLNREISRKIIDKKTAVATVTLLMLETGMRVGGGRGRGATGKTIRRDKKTGEEIGVVETSGATTLKRSHVTIEGDKVTLNFVGKKGVDRTVEVHNRILAQSIKNNFMGGKNSAPDDDKFLFINPENGQPIGRKDVAARIKKFDPDYKPKDLRTLKANEIASQAAMDIMSSPIPIPDTDLKKKALANKIVKQIAKRTSDVLGNTPAVAKSDYINPKLMEAVLEMVGL